MIHFIGVPGSVKNPYKPLMVNSEEKCYNGTKHISKEYVIFLSPTRTWLLKNLFYIIQCKILYSNVFFRSDQGDRKGQTQTARWSEVSSKVRRGSETFLWYRRRVNNWKRRKLLTLEFRLWSVYHSLGPFIRGKIRRDLHKRRLK